MTLNLYGILKDRLQKFVGVTCTPVTLQEAINELTQLLVEREVKKYKDAAEGLFSLLDDISTIDDWAKSDDVGYRREVGKKAEQRTRFMHSPDGYTVVLGPETKSVLVDDLSEPVSPEKQASVASYFEGGLLDSAPMTADFQVDTATGKPNPGVLITHLPTGLSAKCTAHQSLSKNKSEALQLLRMLIEQKRGENVGYTAHLDQAEVTADEQPGDREAGILNVQVAIPLEKKPCTDPDKMLGAADQHSGHEYPGEYEE